MATWVLGFDEGSGADRDLLGGKGANLAEMTRLGLPVPPGFTVTTEACRAFLATDNTFPEGLWEQVLDGISRIERQMGRMQAIYNSMNRKERQNTDMLDGLRRRRIARGAGVDVAEVGQFIKQFEMSRDMMRAVGGMGMMGKLKLMKGLMGGGLSNLGQPGGPMLKTKRSGWQAPRRAGPTSSSPTI